VPLCQVSTTINAPIDLVWTVLVDVERMPEWTPTVHWVRVLDDLPPGSGVGRGSSVRMKQPWLLTHLDG
jgi:uncharacterized membrane protein